MERTCPTAIHIVNLTIRGSACCVDRFGWATGPQLSFLHSPSRLAHREEAETCLNRKEFSDLARRFGGLLLR